MKKITFIISTIILMVIITGCNDFNIDDLSDEDLERISEKAVVCDKPYIRVGIECCLDKNDNSICDVDEKVKIAREEEKTTPVVKKQTSNLPAAAYTDSRHVPRTIRLTTPQWETRPSFFWSTPYYSEPAIKGYWVSIDSTTEWTLVKPPTGKTWTSQQEIADGTHTFRIRAEYGDGRFGEAGSIYFDTSTQFPDITVEEITWESTLFRDGNPPLYEIKVSAVIKNDASKDFIGADNLPVTAITIYLHVNGAWRTTANSLQQLFAGKEKEITFKPIYLTEGEHELQVILDQSDTIKESDEDNNVLVATIDVGSS